MADWIEVARVVDFPPGTVRTVEVEGTQIAVFNLDGGNDGLNTVVPYTKYDEMTTFLNKPSVITGPYRGIHMGLKSWIS